MLEKNVSTYSTIISRIQKKLSSFYCLLKILFPLFTTSYLVDFLFSIFCLFVVIQSTNGNINRMVQRNEISVIDVFLHYVNRQVRVYEHYFPLCRANKCSIKAKGRQKVSFYFRIRKLYRNQGQSLHFYDHIYISAIPYFKRINRGQVFPVFLIHCTKNLPQLLSSQLFTTLKNILQRKIEVKARAIPFCRFYAL